MSAESEIFPLTVENAVKLNIIFLKLRGSGCSVDGWKDSEIDIPFSEFSRYVFDSYHPNLKFITQTIYKNVTDNCKSVGYRRRAIAIFGLQSVYKEQGSRQLLRSERGVTYVPQDNCKRILEYIAEAKCIFKTTNAWSCTQFEMENFIGIVLGFLRKRHISEDYSIDFMREYLDDRILKSPSGTEAVKEIMGILEFKEHMLLEIKYVPDHIDGCQLDTDDHVAE